MTPSQLAYYLRQQGRMHGLQSDMISALIKAIKNLRQSIGDRKLAELVAVGDLHHVLADILSADAITRGLIPVAQQIQKTVERAFWQTVPDLPKGGKIDGVLAVTFGHLNPDVIEAIRTLNTRVLDGITTTVRDGIRAYVENGLRDGASVGSIARNIRSYLGLGPSQVQEVLNYRDALLGQNGRAITDYALRNRVVDGLLEKHGALTAEQVDRYTAAYRDARLAQNAKTIAGTAMKDAYKLGQTTSWQSARESGLVPDGFVVMKRWTGVMDDREREEHVIMEGDTVPMDEPYSNGNLEPGQDSFNCRCISQFFVARPSAE